MASTLIWHRRPDVVVQPPTVAECWRRLRTHQWTAELPFRCGRCGLGPNDPLVPCEDRPPVIT